MQESGPGEIPGSLRADASPAILTPAMACSAKLVRSLLPAIQMKAAADNANRQESDFYLTTLAPLDHQTEARIGAADVLLLTVLFLELAVLIRLLLAS